MKIEINLSKKKVKDLGFKVEAYTISEGLKEKGDCFFSKYPVDLKSYFKESDFTGKKGSFVSLTVSPDKKEITHLFFAGFGKKEGKYYSIESLRRAVGSAVTFAIAKKTDSLALCVPDSKLFGMKSEQFLEQIYSIASMSAYKFDDYISKKDSKKKRLKISISVADSDQKVILTAEKNGKIIADAVNGARKIVNTPPSDLTPTDLADYAKKVAKDSGLKYTVFDEKKIKSLGMGGLAAVSAGSDQGAKFVILEYKSKKAKAPTIGFVGKGITFDSGGLSLKPAQYMETMKEDMAGSAAVISAMSGIGQMKPDVNVVAFVALAENMPGPSATKPGDIITFYNGKTAEVRNTDAEGRLVLADALAYGTKNYKLDAIVDVATLTGACIYAVGPFFTALISDNKIVSEKINTSGESSGDKVWTLPFTDDFKAAIKSDVADIQNVGSPAIAAGTITAACFLRNFSGDTPWAHLDIASTAFNVPNISYYPKGATGSSVRLLIDLAVNW